MSREALLEFGEEYNFQINKGLPEDIRLELLAVLYKRKKPSRGTQTKYHVITRKSLKLS